MLRNSAINFVLKVGLGLACIGFGLYSLAYPNATLEFYPQFVPNIIGDLATLIIGSIVSLFMATWIFSRRHKFACSSTFLILIFLAILANLNSLRFVSVAWPLFIISLALTIRYYPRVRIIVPHEDGEKMRIVPIKDYDESSVVQNTENDVLDQAPTPMIAETPASLESDPAQTSEFLNSEKFVRGNKFFKDEQQIIEDIPTSTDISPTIPAERPKRASRPRAKSIRKASTPRKSAHPEIHEEF